MSNTSQFQQIAGKLPNLALLFRWFNRGRHLNRIAEPVLWEELERNLDDYMAIFTALGSELRLDGRGFAWFHQDAGSSNTNKATREMDTQKKRKAEMEQEVKKASEKIWNSLTS